jgi:hypothetical protein
MQAEERHERVGDTADGAIQPEPPPDDQPAIELLNREDVAKYRAGWLELQTRFVDDPRAAVRDADRLVGDVARSLTATMSERKQELENAWQQHGSNAETEALRQVLRRYRSFFDRLLNV